MNDEIKRPRSVATGDLFGAECHVLDDGRRIFSQSGAVRVLNGGGPKRGDLGRYLGRLPSRFAHLAGDPNIEFVLPQGGVAHGVEASRLIDICQAYVDAFFADELRSDQEHLARNAHVFINAAAKVGVEALVDEATGHQANREGDYLRRRLEKHLRDKAAQWEMTFSPSFVRALAPLYGVAYTAGRYPRALASAFGFIYDVLMGKDVASELRRRNPEPKHGSNHHQYLQSDTRGMFVDDLRVLEVLAAQCRTWDEFRSRVMNHYRGEPMQTRFW